MVLFNANIYAIQKRPIILENFNFGITIYADRSTRRHNLSRAKRRDRVNSRPDTEQNLIQINQYLRKKQQVSIVPRNLSQENYLELLKNPRKFIVFAIGPAGTGKTMLAVQMAIKLTELFCSLTGSEIGVRIPRRPRPHLRPHPPAARSGMLLPSLFSFL